MGAHAFPHPHKQEYGLTTEEYFAAEAMKVFLAHDLEKRVNDQKGLDWVKAQSWALANLMTEK